MDLQHIRKPWPKHLKSIWIVLWRYFWMTLQCIVTWIVICTSSNYVFKSVENIVGTLTLGSQTRQGLAKVQAKSEAQESHFMLPWVWENVREWTFTLPNELPLWELESQWTSEFSESNRKGQNPFHWRVPYIIAKLLKRRCLKWARMTHLGYLKHKLWPKERSGVKLPIWSPTIKS
jgi:hypothetical protein